MSNHFDMKARSTTRRVKTYHRIDKSDKKDRVAEVCYHLGALGNCTGNNGGQGTGKGKLEEPLMIRGVVHQEEVGVADECFLVNISIITTIGELRKGSRQWPVKC